MKKYLALFLCIMLISGVAACSNTADGAGRDIENMGQWMQNNF